MERGGGEEREGSEKKGQAKREKRPRLSVLSLHWTGTLEAGRATGRTE